MLWGNIQGWGAVDKVLQTLGQNWPHIVEAEEQGLFGPLCRLGHTLDCGV